MITTHPPALRKGADFLYHVDPVQLKAQGVTLVGLYLKNTTKAHIAAYHKAGISVFMIHQRGYEGRLADSAAYGKAAGLEANRQATLLGYPKDLPIVFASMGDYDNTGTLTARSVAYYAAADLACEWPAGAYGDHELFNAIGATPLSCQAAAKSWSWNWVTNKWRGVHPTAHLLQHPSRVVAVAITPWQGTRADPLDITRQVKAWGPGLPTPPAPKPVTPVVVAKPILRRTISRTRNPEVVLLQRHLAFLHLYPAASIDGRYGPITQAAVKKLQLRLKRSVTGTYDSPTAKALQVYLTNLKALAK